MISPAQRDRRDHVHPQDCGAVIGLVKPTNIADMITRACETLVVNKKRIAFSMLL